MNILIKSATIVDASSPYNNNTCDILIKNGIISKIADSISQPDDCDSLELPNLHISKGWIDTSVSFGEPGYEERETISKGTEVASKSGFTSVVVNTNTNPIPDTSSDIAFIKSKAVNSAVNVYPLGALTIKSNGEALAELFDMASEGAVAFYDYQKPISNANLIKIALQYAQGFDGLVYSFPLDEKIAGKGVANEGENTTQLGLKGIPALSEDIQIARDLFILEYTGGKLHIPTVSTAKSVELISDAKAKGLDVSCSVSIANLILTDATLSDFDTNCKLLPPLRMEDDKTALVQAIKDGIIDFITSDHNPIDIEHKKVAFDHALYGSIGLEAAFGALQPIFGLNKTIQLLTSGKQRYNIPAFNIEEGQKACISLFNPDAEYTFGENNILSTSKNCAFLGQQLKGKSFGIINNNQLILND